MAAPIAAVRRKPLPDQQFPGPPPMPPPPDFDPFPQRRPVLRGARSTPNLRDSAVPSIYDPPPAYEEFPGVDASGRLNIIPPSPGRLPSPAPPSPGPLFPGPPSCAESFNEPRYRPYRPPASPVSPVSPMSTGPPPPSKSEASSPASHYQPSHPSGFHPPVKSGTFAVPSNYVPPPPPPFPPPSIAATFPVAAQERPPASPVFPGPPSAETFPSAGPRPPVSPSYAPSEAPSADSQAQEKTFWQTALDETKYFAGGLISHPFEYTKHYAILRHSTVLVWYRGPSTSVTVTIFSDAPLPPTRTVWLQRKGFSGNMGMNLKSLVGANDSWLDVTPSSQASPTDMAEGDERGCQRDIKKFLKKAPKNLSKHMPRETHVIRIPAAADDGYFRLVLCTGGGDGGSSKRKVLCPSPVFRIASTSTDASVVRGASFASMPLELGIKAGSIVANTVVNRYVGPAAAVVQSRTKKLQTAKFVTKHATHIAYGKSAIDKSGVKTTVTEYEAQYATTRGGGYAPWQGDDAGFDEAPPEVIGPDSGPMDPFPIKFDGKIVRGTGRSGMELGIPTANLSGIPEDVKMRMRGVYFGWARVVPRSGLEHISTDWHESIITVGPAPYATPRVAAENVATVHIIHEFGGALFLETKLKVIVMGQLRVSTPPVGSDAALQAYGTDVLLTVASLSRDNWGPIETRERMRTMRSEMSLADRYVETREKVQKQVDRIPVHLAGVRTEGAALRDKAYGNGGIWIPRWKGSLF